MNRPPKKTIAAALGGIFLALSASYANAAGLGKLTVTSALGQVLSAEIELVSLQPGEFEVLTARVASPDAYQEARIEYPPLLRQLRFAIERKANGMPVLKISSVTPVNEPFVDLLVEMSWPSGRLVREYPILLDPPGFTDARIQAPVAAAAPRPSAAPAPAQLTSATPSAKAESTAGKGDTYGPVKRGDTLAKIANEMKSDGVSLDQMLVALFRENKQAFGKNNMNVLKTGQILRIPSAAEIAKIAREEATKEVRVQVADWKGYREQIAGAVAAAPAKPAPTNVATGQVAAAKPVTPPPAPATDQLKIAKSETTGKAGAAGTKGGVDAANAAKEDAIAKQKAMAEASARIAALEKQQADAKKLLELKSAPPVAGKPADSKPAQVAQATPPTPAVVAPAATTAVPAKPGDAPKAEAPKTDAAKPAPAAAPKPPVKAPVPAPKEPELMDTVMDNLPIIAGIGGAGVLGIGGLLFMRRRKQAGSSGSGMTQTSSLMPSDLKPNTITGNKAGGLVDTGNSSFLTDFDKAGPGAIDTDEVDPVAEAEVYIAYGRDAQAEEILKEAMVRDKNRHEISMKLLEIYHARKSAPAFETVARELKVAVGENDPMWAKAASMGSSIDPGNDLYGGRPYEATGAFAAGDTAVKAPEVGADPAKPDLDFDLGFDGSATTKLPDATFDVTAPNTDQPVPEAGDALDFDLDLGAPEAASTAPADSGGLDFDLALDSPAPSVATPETAEVPAAATMASGFDFDLSSLSLDEPSTSPAAKPAPAAAPAMSLDLSDLSLDLDSPAPASSGGGDAGAVATKLELAKAYIEIGDSDGAKEILNEVTREGSPAQAQEAKTILAGL